MLKTISDICKYKIVPLVSCENTSDVEQVVGAICEGGINVVEVPFRSKEAIECLKIVSRKFPDLTIGAGTVLTLAQAKEAIEGGAKFIVSPGFNDDVVKYAINQNICVFPGVMTPTEIGKAIAFGLNLVKFFPAETAGGIAALKAFRGPFPQVMFMPTGGINELNFEGYLNQKNVFAVGGSWIASKRLIANHDYSEITRLSQQALGVVVNINAQKIAPTKVG